jgi:hypothetical protein
MYQKDELFEWLKVNHDEMWNYCRQDVLSLHELFFVLRDTFEACTHTFKNHGKYYDSFYTIAGLAKYAWEQGLAKEIFPQAPKTYETWSNCKKAVIGGRAQCFKPGKHEGKFVFLDVKSMYPYVMTNRVFPCGQETPTNTYVRGKCGIYLVDIHFQRLPLIVPRRDPNPQVALDWNFTGCQEKIWLSSVDIEMLWRY